MKKNKYTSLLLIGIGLYFFIIQFNHPLIESLNTWSVLIIAIGIWLVFLYLKGKNQQLLSQGLTVLFIGIHFYGIDHFQNWINHWAMIPLSWGLALIITSVVTRKYLLPAIFVTLFSLLFIFSDKLPSWFISLQPIESEIIAHFPLLLIALGIVLYVSKNK